MFCEAAVHFAMVHVSILSVQLFFIRGMDQKIETMGVHFVFHDRAKVHFVKHDHFAYGFAKRI